MQTNADKYNLTKEQIKEIAQEIDIIYQNDENVANAEQATIVFFNKPVKPTLTEDERVILRNIDTDYYPTIKKMGETLYIVSKEDLYKEIDCMFKDHLFKFIKERRRIRDKKVAK